MKAESGRGHVIGNFAKLMRGPPRVVEADEVAHDAPPERFTQKISDEGGDVYVAPLLEALRAALAKAKRQPGEDASTTEPQRETPVAGTQARP